MRRSLSALLLVLVAGPAFAQLDFTLPGSRGSKASDFADVAKTRTAIVPAEAKPGQEVTFELTIIPEPGSYTYPVNIPPGQVGSNTIKLPPPGDLIFVGTIADPTEGLKPTQSLLDPSVTEMHYPFPATPTWRLKAIVSPDAKPGKKTVVLTDTTLQACDSSGCYSTLPSSRPSAEFTVLDAPAVPVPAKYAAEVSRALARRSAPPPAPRPEPSRAEAPPAPPAAEAAGGLIPKAALPTEQYKERMEAVRAKIDATPVRVQGGFGGLLLAAAFWGFVSLVTPCVFPMIPITVSLFLKQGQQSTRAAVRLAAAYCLTIVAVLGASAIFLLSVFQQLSNDPYMNLFLGALFVVFALSLFGMYDITLPGFLLRATERRRGAGGLIGTVFGALAFSVVSFTCVAPFLGGFAGMTASGQFNQAQLVLAGLVFAAAFASPFFVLALFPSLLKKLPKSGGWLDSVKAVMGFLELAAAFKFFRSAELLASGRPVYFTYDLVLGAWVAISIVAGLYALNLFRLPHDEERPNVGVSRMLLGVAFLGLAVYVAPALFKSQRPAGVVYAWVNAFLLPESAEPGGDELPWSTDLKGAIDHIVQAKRSSGRAEKPYIFLDFTGVNCTNCKLNEKNVFPQAKVRELLRQYSRVQLYADVMPPHAYLDPPLEDPRRDEAGINLEFQNAVFGNAQRPLYVILEPLTTGKVRVVGVYDEGKINDVPRFIEFLKAPLEKK
jgi:thiol:disulfide interchange protein DsbD